ncbi:MAG TPA: hypothetical protein VMV46_14890 [Thermoanaerobaculia bacterium]|nr:hypothetical protein [Thermoanaerobaculia bacterium]
MVLSVIFAIVALVASIIILIHAFQASTGQGFLCLCVPFYILYYAFARFEHPKKGMILAALLAGWGLAIALNVAATVAGFGSMAGP